MSRLRAWVGVPRIQAVGLHGFRVFGFRVLDGVRVSGLRF